MHATDGKVCTPTEGPIRAESCAHQADRRAFATPGRTNRPGKQNRRTRAGVRQRNPGVGRKPEGPTNEQRRRESTPTREHADKRQRDARQRTIRRPRPGGHDRGADASPPRHNRVALAAWRLVLGGRQPAARPRAGARGSSARAGAEPGSRSSAPARAEQAGRRTRHGGPRRDAAAAPGRDQMEPDQGQGRRRNGARKRRPGGAERAATEA